MTQQNIVGGEVWLLDQTAEVCGIRSNLGIPLPSAQRNIVEMCRQGVQTITMTLVPTVIQYLQWIYLSQLVAPFTVEPFCAILVLPGQNADSELHISRLHRPVWALCSV